MPDVTLSVGTKFYVSAAEPATYDTAGFGALSWTEVGEVESLGEFGGNASITNFVPLGTGVVKKRKGSIDYGTVSAAIGRLVGDTGQAILKAGFDGAAKYTVHSFKVVNADASIAYFTGIVGSFTKVVNDSNAVTMVNCNVEIDNNVISDDYNFHSVVYSLGTNPANGSIIGDTNQTVANGDDATAVYAAPIATKTFVDWSDLSTDNPRTDLAVGADIAVSANFSA